MELGQRAKQRREELGLTQDQVAKFIGVSQEAVNLMEKRDSRSNRNVVKLAEILRVDPNWLTTGQGIPSSDGGKLSESSITQLVPIAPWEDLKEWLSDRPSNSQTIPTTHPPDNAFALEIKDNSMVSSSFPSFPERHFIVCSEHALIEDGDYVVVEQNGIVIFRKLVSSKTMLQPSNPQWPTEKFTGVIIGKAIDCYYPSLY
ncbi:MAG: helix-turn-helix domain-containing protein [Gammaproteobacteria bacterium]|nr:helix-turn-helix domain-containing protein [Gammaproteobacteria bacterium]